MVLQFDVNDTKLVISKEGNSLVEIEALKNDYKFYTEDVDWPIASQIFQSDINDIPNGLKFSSDMKSSIFDLADWIEFEKGESSFVKISITFNWDSWDKPTTVHDFLKCYKSDMELLGFECEVIKDDDWASLSIKGNLSKGNVQDSIDEVIRVAKRRYKFVVTQIHKKGSSNILVKVFDFPKEHEVACVQYLIWFGEFLSALDINATVSAEKRDDVTNIIVSPVDAPELLKTIENLFTQYLTLPYIEYLPAHSQQLTPIDRANLQQLVNQIEGFKNQIQMKNAIIELKEATIEQLKSDLTLANKNLVLLDSLIDKPDVEIANSGLSLTSWQWGIFKIEPQKLLKKLTKKV
ncbi:hypothetical protein DU976_21070 [Vibrio navarrensis]|uniref:Uncharacterized protein n=1 Tax=Vibrio navarrensis TaxID=29495 RepID=A0AAI9CYM9_9VIBR|nr:hypothetical protein [Vibrio navarrensis]EJL6397029.1 hypothetical protein [Vibrio navarrensis]ELN6934644.1 hypothetical protein [Vibrio navarrensis]